VLCSNKPSESIRKRRSLLSLKRFSWIKHSLNISKASLIFRAYSCQEFIIRLEGTVENRKHSSRNGHSTKGLFASVRVLRVKKIALRGLKALQFTLGISDPKYCQTSRFHFIRLLFQTLDISCKLVD